MTALRHHCAVLDRSNQPCGPSSQPAGGRGQSEGRSRTRPGRRTSRGRRRSRCARRWPTTRPSASYSVEAVKVLRPSLPAALARPRRAARRSPAGRRCGRSSGPSTIGRSLEVAGPAADAVQRRPGRGDRRPRLLVDVGVPVLGEARVRRPGGGDAVAGRPVADRPGKIRSPSPSLARRAAGEAGGERVERRGRGTTPRPPRRPRRARPGRPRRASRSTRRRASAIGRAAEGRAS